MFGWGKQPEDELPDDEMEIRHIEIKHPDDLDKLPPEVVVELTKAMFMEHGRLMFNTRVLLVEVTRVISSMYAVARRDGKHKAAERELKRLLDLLGEYVDEQGIMSRKEFDVMLGVTVDMANGTIKDAEDAERVHRQRLAAAGLTPSDGPMSGPARPTSDAEKARKLSDIFSGLNPNSNRVKGPEDLF